MNHTTAFTRRQVLAICAGVVLPAHAQQQVVERVQTPFSEAGTAVELETVIVRPQGDGPFPTVMFNHGSTGRGDNPARVRQTFASGIVSRFLNEHGWMVVYPQRRGRGRSGGVYDEGFEFDRSRYSCLPKLSLPGIDRALEDLDVVLTHLQGRSDVNPKALVIGGVSRGGILSMAHAARHPSAYAGVVNFVGGWVGEDCPSIGAINTATFEKSASYPRETIWLYGESDSIYSMRHSRRNYDAFISAGGKGAFHAFDLGPGNYGHLVLSNPYLWEKVLSEYLVRIR